jgi:hypothetical protein
MELLERSASGTCCIGSTVTVGAVVAVHAGPVKLSLTVFWGPS